MKNVGIHPRVLLKSLPAGSFWNYSFHFLSASVAISGSLLPLSISLPFKSGHCAKCVDRNVAQISKQLVVIDNGDTARVNRSQLRWRGQCRSSARMLLFFIVCCIFYSHYKTKSLFCLAVGASNIPHNCFSLFPISSNFHTFLCKKKKKHPFLTKGNAWEILPFGGSLAPKP